MLKLAPEKQEFVAKQLERNISPTVISRAFQRKFGTVLRPQDIENLRGVIFKPVKKRDDVEQIKAKLGSHDEQLEWARAKLRQRMDDEDVSNNDLVNLARELRSNITASQQIASMNDEKGEAQYILVYGDTVQQTSPKADIQDIEFNVLGDSDD